MPQKILELKGSDFLKGLSLQSAFPIGGLWQYLANYNPFQKIGRLYPTLGPTRKDGGSIPIVINAFDFYSNGTTKYLFAFGDHTAANQAAYQINLDTDAITDISSSVFLNRTGYVEQCSMCKIWKGYIIYDERSATQVLRSITTGITGDVTILSGLTSSPKHPCVVGPDGYLYVGNYSYIAQLTSATGTSGNTANKFDTLQTDLTCRDLDHDGQYIFAGFDNNDYETPLSGIVTDCQIIIWDRFKSYAEKRYQLKEAYIIAVRCLGTSCYVLTPSGWYVCSIASSPVLIYPMSSESPFNHFPADYNQVSKDATSIYWGDKAGSGYIFAIGQAIAGQPKIIYQPYYAIGITENQKALIVSGSYKYVSTTTPRIYKLNDATGMYVTAMPVPTSLPSPYTFSFTKVILETPLSTGQQVIHALFNSAGEVISGQETQSFSSAGAKKTLIFRRNATGATINDFTDLYPEIISNAEIVEIQVFGDPMPDTHNVQI